MCRYLGSIAEVEITGGNVFSRMNTSVECDKKKYIYIYTFNYGSNEAYDVVVFFFHSEFLNRNFSFFDSSERPRRYNKNFAISLLI